MHPGIGFLYLLYSNNGCETEKGRNGKEADGNQTLLDTYDIAFQPYSSGWVVVTHYPPAAALQVSTCRDKEWMESCFINTINVALEHGLKHCFYYWNVSLRLINRNIPVPMGINRSVQIYLSCALAKRRHTVFVGHKQRRVHVIIGTCLISADIELNLCLINYS